MHGVMTLRFAATRILIAVGIVIVAVACLSSRAFASVVGVSTIAAVVIDVIVHDAPKPRGEPRATLVVDLAGRADRR